jgi:hypothetical protein
MLAACPVRPTTFAPGAIRIALQKRKRSSSGVGPPAAHRGGLAQDYIVSLRGWVNQMYLRPMLRNSMRSNTSGLTGSRTNCPTSVHRITASLVMGPGGRSASSIAAPGWSPPSGNRLLDRPNHSMCHSVTYVAGATFRPTSSKDV